jgi:hypothetical protein
MMIDFQKLDWRQFELLCGSILAAEGFEDVRQNGRPGQVQHGVDLTFSSPDGKQWVAQVKHFRHLSSPSLLQSAINDVERGRVFFNADKAFLMLSTPVNFQLVARLDIPVNLEVWDAERLALLIEKHPAVKAGLLDVIQAEKRFNDLFSGQVRSTPESTQASELIARLDSVAAGKPGATGYELVCTDILIYAFSPYLRAPKIQNTSEDGLDRRDAIFPIGSGSQFWDDIKYSYSSRLLVVEFKNYVDPIGQAEVESLQQYLYARARRSFGIICSRQGPAKPAIAARRRAWMLADNLILFLADGDLKDLVHLKLQGKNPAAVLDAQMDEFFLKLSP